LSLKHPPTLELPAARLGGSTGGLPVGAPRKGLECSFHSYWLPREQPFAIFLFLSTALFAASVGFALLLPAREKLPPLIEVDLGVEGIENEPPPLGEPDAGVGEVAPEVPAPEEPPAAPPEPEPTPEPEPEPEIQEETPPTPPQPEFTVPEEKPVAVATPKPKPKAKIAAKPAGPPKAETVQRTTPAGGPAGSGATTGNAGVRGSPTGVAGGRGGGRGDFVSTPHPQYDATAKQRGYEGRGTFLITYSNGRITSVSVHQSTGVGYLDSRTISWIKSRWRVKSGASGSGRLPITWRMK
jgi:protein TonB